MSNDRIARVHTLVEAACRRDANVFGYGVWTHHIVHVVAYGKRLAAQRGADVEVVELAALLHDYAGIKDAAFVKDHHIHGAEQAQQLLSELGYASETTERIRQCILTHRGSVPMARPSVEAQCLTDADAMAHFDGVPSLLHYQFVSQGKTVEEAVAWVRAKLERSWRKLDDDAKDLVRPQYKACLTVLQVPKTAG